MRFQLRHETKYAYGAPVTLGPHVIRLRPRRDPFQIEEAYSLHIDPQPAGFSEGIDAEGNAFTLVWFTGKTSRLSVVADATVRVERENPFDYLVLDLTELTLPLRNRADAGDVLGPYLYRSQPTPEVNAFAQEIADAVHGETIPFLGELAQRIYARIERQVREYGDPHPAHVTLKTGAGSCRDLAALFMDACRSQNIPARFVSGYWRGAPDQRHELHAWAEVCVSGGGWRAYDPASGGAVVDAHIPVAAAAQSPNAAPIAGAYFGSATARLETSLDLSAG